MTNVLGYEGVMQLWHHVSFFPYLTLMLIISEGDCASIHLCFFVGKWYLGSRAMLRGTQRCLVITDRQTAVARHQRHAARFMSLWGWSHCMEATSQHTVHLWNVMRGPEGQNTLCEYHLYIWLHTQTSRDWLWAIWKATLTMIKWFLNMHEWMNKLQFRTLQYPKLQFMQQILSYCSEDFFPPYFSDHKARSIFQKKSLAFYVL